MLFRFTVKADNAEDFVLHVEADSKNTFTQLHEFLQKECGFGTSQFSAFYIADEEWDKGDEIKLFGITNNGTTTENRIGKNSNLGEIIKSEEDRLLYIFDKYNERYLYLELYEIAEGNRSTSPAILLHRGTAPIQGRMINPENGLSGKDDPDSQHIFDDLGELNDLNEIYGEMSSQIL